MGSPATPQAGIYIKLSSLHRRARGAGHRAYAIPLLSLLFYEWLFFEGFMFLLLLKTSICLSSFGILFPVKYDMQVVGGAWMEMKLIQKSTQGMMKTARPLDRLSPSNLI